MRGTTEASSCKAAGADVALQYAGCSGWKHSASAGHMRTLTTRVTHVLPVSDDGGSTAEIVRVLGGPAVGDIRSRCLRLADDSNEEVNEGTQLM